MFSRSRKSPYESYRSGQGTLLGMTVITAVNLLLSAFSFRLFFPLSAWLPRDLLWRGKEAAAGSPLAAAFYAGCGVLFCCYVVFTFLSYGNDRFPAMRAAFLLYAADSLYYLVTVALPSITKDGFRLATIIEFLFRWFALVQLYRADSVFRDPERKNPRAKIKEPPAPEPDDDGDDEDDDEGIQW